LEISTISKEVVMGDQNEDTKRKLDDMRIQKRQTQWWQRGLSWRMQCTWGRFLRNNLDRQRLVSNPARINEYIKLELSGAWELHTVNALRKIVQFEALGLVFLMETKLPLRAKNRMSNIKNSLGLTQGLVVLSDGKSGGLALF